MFFSTKITPSIAPFSERVEQLRRLVREADYVLIGAGAGLTTAAGLDYAGEDFRREFSECVQHALFGFFGAHAVHTVAQNRHLNAVA